MIKKNKEEEEEEEVGKSVSKKGTIKRKIKRKNQKENPSFPGKNQFPKRKNLSSSQRKKDLFQGNL